ncbi:hypothetical protein IAD21_03368 [Abditibacteriota bacterium]|nr:hypothetical protein IAD21_03368 [Abditibacteriota bacterium]
MSFLSPESVQLELAPDGTLRALLPDRCGMNVQILRAFPLSRDDQYFVLRDGKNNELGMLESTGGLSPQNVELLKDSLDNRYFLPQITKIYTIFEKFGSSQWDVETDRGRVQIASKALHEAMTELSPVRFLIRDNEDNRFEIRDVTKLDEESQKRFGGR